MLLLVKSSRFLDHEQIPKWLTVWRCYKSSSSYSDGWWAELITKRQDGSRVYVMLHPLCQARLAQQRGEKGTEKQMNRGNEGTHSFQFGCLPACDIAHVEVLLMLGYSWLHIGNNSPQLFDVWACVGKKTKQKGVRLNYDNVPCLFNKTCVRWYPEKAAHTDLFNFCSSRRPDN